MTSWIESQSSPVIAAIVFGLVYLAAAAIFLLAAWVSRLSIGKQVGSLTPALLSPLGTILGILIVFLAARVWANLDRAHEYVIHEISALREAGLIVKSLPPSVEEQVHADLKAHVEFVVSEEWPAMGDRRADLKMRATHLEVAMRTLLAFSPEAENQKLAQSRALAAIENAFENRRYRIAISRMEIELDSMDRRLGAVGDRPDHNRLGSHQSALGDGGRSVRLLDRDCDLPGALDGIRQTVRSGRFRPRAIGLSRCDSRLTPRRDRNQPAIHASPLRPHVSTMPPRSPACAPLSRPCGSARYSVERISWRREAVRANSNASAPSAPE